MTARLELCFSDFMTKTGHIRRWLILEGEEGGEGFSPEMAANVRGWSLVWMSACAEGFWSSFLSALCEEFSNKPARFHRRKIRAQALYIVNDLSNGAPKDLIGKWDRSFGLVEGLAVASRATMSAAVPYDGKTVRPKHVDLLWKLFELPGNPFPSMIHRQSLETMADDRNDIAHGRKLPATVGRLRTKQDVTDSLRRLEESFEGCYTAAVELLK